MIAVVVAGLLLGHKAPIVQTAQSRIAERMNWRTIAFVLENTVFLLIGLQAHWIVQDVTESDLSGRLIVGVCAAVLVGCIVLRIAWVFAARYLLIRPGPDPTTGQRPPWTFTLILGWAGIRGVVTLAAAFIIPEDTPNREVLLLIAFTVVAGTLFIQGLSLPMLARRLHVPAPDPMEDALARATLLQQASKAGYLVLKKMEYDDQQGVTELIKQRIEQRNFAAWERLGTQADVESPSELYARIRLEMIDAERKRVLEVRDQGQVASDIVERGAGDARRRGVDDRRRPGQPGRAEDGVLAGAPHRRLVRPPRGPPGATGRAGTVTRVPGLPRRRDDLGVAAALPGLRQHRLLRLLGDAARHRALPGDHAPRHAVRRAPGGLALVLRAPRHGLSRDVVAVRPAGGRRRGGSVGAVGSAGSADSGGTGGTAGAGGSAGAGGTGGAAGVGGTGGTGGGGGGGGAAAGPGSGGGGGTGGACGTGGGGGGGGGGAVTSRNGGSLPACSIPQMPETSR